MLAKYTSDFRYEAIQTKHKIKTYHVSAGKGCMHRNEACNNKKNVDHLSSNNYILEEACRIK